MRRLLALFLRRSLRFLFAFLPLTPLASHGLRRRKAASLVRSARKPAWVAGRIIRLKALMPDAGCRRIADSFNRCHAARTGVSVGKSFVADTVRAQHYAILRERRHLRRRRAGCGPRNIVWGLDLTGKEDSIRRSSDILGVIDHGTRRLLGLTPMAATIVLDGAWTSFPADRSVR